MPRVFALLLAVALLFQFNWAVAASYCEHETSPTAALHFGHHVHVHKAADGQATGGGELAQDDDCAFHHAGHPALVALVPVLVAAASPAPASFRDPSFGGSAPLRAPDRPQWRRLA